MLAEAHRHDRKAKSVSHCNPEEIILYGLDAICAGGSQESAAFRATTTLDSQVCGWQQKLPQGLLMIPLRDARVFLELRRQRAWVGEGGGLQQEGLSAVCWGVVGCGGCSGW